MNRKVIVIGLDGATFDIIDPMIEGEHLPHIARLVANGTRPIRLRQSFGKVPGRS